MSGAPALAPPRLELAARLTVELAPPVELGAGRAGGRRIVRIIGGTAEGPLLAGHILDLGADWQRSFADGVSESWGKDGRDLVGGVDRLASLGIAEGRDMAGKYDVYDAAERSCSDPYSHHLERSGLIAAPGAERAAPPAADRRLPRAGMTCHP